MSETDDILKSVVYNADVIAAKKATSLIAYEEKIVKKILTSAGMANNAKELAMRAKEKTGKARLSFELFYEEYPTFPVYLAIRKLPFVHKIMTKDLFNKFCSTIMFKEWQWFVDEAPVVTKPIGLVFDWPGIKGTQMVLHNMQCTQEWFDNNLRLVRAIGSGKNIQLITVEQFDPFIKELLSYWMPPPF